MLERTDFRIVHISIQSNHIHLLVEANDPEALARGMQAFQISAARKLNKLLGRTGSYSRSLPFDDHHELSRRP